MRKYKCIKKPKKRINKSIYKSNINKQHVKVNVSTGGSIPSISHMHAPAYPNLMDINSSVKGTIEDLIKKHQQQTPTNIPVPNVNNPLNRFENTNQQTYPLGDVLNESKREPINLFEGYDNGSFINSEDYEDDEPASIFLKSGKDTEEFFRSPLKEKQTTPSIRKSQIPVRNTPFKAESDEPIKTIWPDVTNNKKKNNINNLLRTKEDYFMIKNHQKKHQLKQLQDQ